MALKITVWDPNPFNPYGAEVARSLARAEAEVTRIARSGMSYPWPGVTERLAIPRASQGRRSLRQAIGYASSVIRQAAQIAASRKRIVVVAWTNTPLERLMFVCLALTGTTIILVEHNPVPLRDPARRYSLTRALRLVAHRLVVHSEELAHSLANSEPSRKLDIAVAAHPLYIAWKTNHQSQQLHDNATRSKDQVLFAGSVRIDKGIQDLPELATNLGDQYKLELAIGFLPNEHRDRFSQIPNIHLLGDGASYLPDEQFYTAMSTAHALVAPYTNVTASGTIMMALTLETPVVSYKSVALDYAPGPVTQVPVGDVKAIATAIRAGEHFKPDIASSRLERYDAATSGQWQQATKRDGKSSIG